MKHLRQYIRQLIVEQINEPLIGAVYCDMDGVLVDFVAGAIELINSELEAAIDPDWTSTRKSIRSSIRRVHRDLGPEYRVKPGADLRAEQGIKNLSYAVIGRDVGGFFRGLPPFQDGLDQLWPFLHTLGVPVHVLSAPISGTGPGGTAGDGKRDWVQILDPAPASVEIKDAVDKPDFAIDRASGKPNVLVDDKTATVAAWNGKGGIGILHVPGKSQASISELERRLTELEE